MEMNQIRYFLAVCEHRNFTKAASASNVSQPALTASIKKLEGELGGPLFLRDRSGCRLTPLGDTVRPSLERIAKETQAAALAATRHIRLDRVPIRIGFTQTVGLSGFASALSSYQRAHPSVDFELLSDGEDLQLERLRSGDLDLLISPDNAVPEDLYKSDTLRSEIYKVVFHPDHRFAGLDDVPLSELAAETYLDRPNCEMRERLMGLAEGEGLEIYAGYRSDREDWLLTMAREGVGVAVLPETSIPADRGLLSRPLGRAPITRDLVALRYRHQPSRPEVEDLVRVLAVRP